MHGTQFDSGSAYANSDASSVKESVKNTYEPDIGPKKTVHQAPVLVVDSYSVEQLLEHADRDIEMGFFPVARSDAERVLAKEPDNCHALLIMLMADLKVQETDKLQEQPYPLDSNPYYQRILRTGNKKYSDYLVEVNRTISGRLKDHWQKELDNVQYILQQSKTVRDVQKAEEILKSVPSFDEADKVRNECLRLKDELAEDTYRLAEKKAAELQWDEAYDLYKSIDTYRQSRVNMIACEDGKKKEIQYCSALKYETDGKFKEALQAFEALGDYRDGNQHITKLKKLVRGNKVRVIGKKHTAAIFVNIALSVFFSLGCAISFPNSIWINLLWGIPLIIVSFVLTIVRSRYRATKRMWMAMGIAFALFIILTVCGAITYGKSSALWSSLFYLIATIFIIV